MTVEKWLIRQLELTLIVVNFYFWTIRIESSFNNIRKQRPNLNGDDKISQEFTRRVLGRVVSTPNSCI